MVFIKLIWDVTFVYSSRRSIARVGARAGVENLGQSKNVRQLYENPADKLGSRGQGSYELTQCPAYESATYFHQTTTNRCE